MSFLRATRILWTRGTDVGRHTGVCSSWVPSKREGYIIDDIGHEDIYVHASSIKESTKRYKALHHGEEVEFHVVRSRTSGGKECVDVWGAGLQPVAGVSRRCWPRAKKDPKAPPASFDPESWGLDDVYSKSTISKFIP